MDPIMAEQVCEAAKVLAERAEAGMPLEVQPRAARFASMKTQVWGQEAMMQAAPTPAPAPPLTNIIEVADSAKTMEVENDEVPVPFDPVPDLMPKSTADQEMDMEEEIPAPSDLTVTSDARQTHEVAQEVLFDKEEIPSPDLSQPAEQPQQTVASHLEIPSEDLPLPRPACVDDIAPISPAEQAEAIRKAGGGKAKSKGKKSKGKKNKKKKTSKDQGDCTEDEDLVSDDGDDQGCDESGAGEEETTKTKAGSKARAKGKAKAATAKAKAKAKAATARAKAKAKAAAAKAKAKAKAATARAKAKAKEAKAKMKVVKAPAALDEASTDEQEAKRSKTKDDEAKPAEKAGKRRRGPQPSEAERMKKKIAQREKASRKSSAYHMARQTALANGMSDEEAKAMGKEVAKLPIHVFSCSSKSCVHTSACFLCQLRLTRTLRDREDHEPTLCAFTQLNVASV